MSWWEERAGLTDTVAVITGGAGGLGLAATRDLAANGVAVAAIDRDGEACERLRDELPDALVTTGDVREGGVLEKHFAAVDDRFGRLDTLVNVVGGTFRAPFTETTERGWDALLGANLTHVLRACHLAVPRMRAGARGGSIINLTTIEAHRAAPNFAVYAAAKAAVEQFARSLAVEVAPDRIRVNNIAPDMTPTPGMMGLAHDADAAAGFTSPGVDIAIPMGRVGTPEDVSGCVVFLASALSAYITGSTLHPDGGTLASSGWLNWPAGFSNVVPADVLDHLDP